MRPRFALYFGNFFYSAHYFLPLAMLTPFLATKMPEAYTGLVIAAGAFLALLSFLIVPLLEVRFGARRSAIGLGILTLALLLSLAAAPAAPVAVLLVALFCAVQPVFAFLLDLLLESTVKTEGSTGRIHTLFITWGSSALVLSPLALGLLLGEGSAYERVFFVAALCLVPFVAIMALSSFAQGSSPKLHHMKEVVHCLFADADIRAVTLAAFMLQFFYHLAPFFVPLYLHTVLGIAWSDLGWMFALMLIPFLVVEYPVGWIADKKLGDQEFMALGFLITGSAFAALAFVTAETPLLAIALTLLISRIGAALVEATTESHFFRRISEKDVNSVGVFRMMRPVAAISAPVIGTLLLVFSTYNVLFYVTGIGIIAIGVAFALSIKDFR